jgi:hypothetical protein
MIDITLRLPDNEAAALLEACRRFRFDDAQNLVRGSRNVRPDHLAEAMTRILAALTAAGVADNDPGRAVVTIAIERADIATNRQFLEAILAAMSP